MSYNTVMNKFYCILTTLLICVGTMTAQTSPRAVRRSTGIRHSAIVEAYADSLNAYRQRLDEALAGNDSLRQALHIAQRNVTRYSMLAPLTYYNAVTRRSFSLDDNGKEQMAADMAMAKMYLRRPDLVVESDRRLAAAGGIAIVPSEPMRQEVDFTSQSEEENQPISFDFTPTDPVELVKVRPNFWTFKGDYSLQFLQNYVSDNWYKGGESSYAMIGAVTLEVGYNDKDKIKWDNKLEMKLGMQSSQGDTIHDFKSSEDLIRLTSKLGIQAASKWYYTLQAIGQTQFTHGLKSNDKKIYSDFMSPLNLNLSLGMDYKVGWCKNKLTGTINISPLATNMKYFRDDDLALGAGYDEGKHSKWDFGSTCTIDLTWKFSDMIRWQTRLYGYTTYHRTEVEWENTFTFQFSKYISTKLFVYPRFDDNAKKRDEKYGYFQLKEYWSLGFNFLM